MSLQHCKCFCPLSFHDIVKQKSLHMSLLKLCSVRGCATFCRGVLPRCDRRIQKKLSRGFIDACGFQVGTLQRIPAVPLQNVAFSRFSLSPSKVRTPARLLAASETVEQSSVLCYGPDAAATTHRRLGRLASHPVFIRRSRRE